MTIRTKPTENSKWVIMFSMKVKANRSSLKLGSCAKLVARFCGPYEILERICRVAYMIALPTSMSIHNVFHVSLLKKYIPNDNHVIDWNVNSGGARRHFTSASSAHFGPKSQTSPEPIHRDCKRSMDLVWS
jgi:hypothetical protein